MLKKKKRCLFETPHIRAVLLFTSKEEEEKEGEKTEKKGEEGEAHTHTVQILVNSVNLP